MIDQLPANSSNYQSNYDAQYQAWLSTAVTSHASMDYGPAQVRISGEELVLVGIMCSYLQLCPSGATSGEIRDYLSRQFKERRKDVVERLPLQFACFVQGRRMPVEMPSGSSVDLGTWPRQRARESNNFEIGHY